MLRTGPEVLALRWRTAWRSHHCIVTKNMAELKEPTSLASASGMLCALNDSILGAAGPAGAAC